MFAFSGSVRFMRRVAEILDMHMAASEGRSCRLKCSREMQYGEDSPLRNCETHAIQFVCGPCSMYFSNCRVVGSGIRRVTFDKYDGECYPTDGKSYDISITDKEEFSIVFSPTLMAATLSMRDDRADDSSATLYLLQDSDVMSLAISEDGIDEDGVFLDIPFERIS